MNDKVSFPLLEQTARAAGWDESVSDIPGFWPENLPGHKCFLSCRWIAPGQDFHSEITNIQGAATVIDGRTLRINPDSMPVSFLRIELDDLAARGVQGAAELLKEGVEKIPSQVAGYLNKQRDGYAYPEYCAHWLPRPGNLKIPSYRPGWPRPDWAR